MLPNPLVVPNFLAPLEILYPEIAVTVPVGMFVMLLLFIVVDVMQEGRTTPIGNLADHLDHHGKHKMNLRQDLLRNRPWNVHSTKRHQSRLMI